mgnify:CR=1 FL=1
MTKRSSFVMPAVLAEVAVIVDILIASPKSVDAKLARCAELGRVKATGLAVHGNIAVKVAPNTTFWPFVRLRARAWVNSLRQIDSGLGSYCGAQIGRLTALRHSIIVRLHTTVAQRTQRGAGPRRIRLRDLA